MKLRLCLLIFAIATVSAVEYPATTTSVVLKYTGSTINLSRFGTVASGDEIECKNEQEWRPLIGDSRFAVMKINGVSPTKWGSGSPNNVVQGWPGWLYWDAAGNALYAKDTGEGTTTGWLAAGSGGGGGSQTPWAQDIDGGGFSLQNFLLSYGRLEGPLTNAAAVEISTTTLAAGAITLSYTNGGAYRLTLSSDSTVTLGNATGTNRSMALLVYPDGTHVINFPSTAVALTPTNQPFAVGLTTIYFTYLDGTNYIEVSPAPSSGAGKALNQTSPAITTPTVTGGTFNSPSINNATTVAPTVTFPTINYAYLTTNNTSFGFYMTGVTNSSGGTINQWEAVYVKSDGSIDKADANGTGTYPSWGLAIASINNGATGTIITMGNVRNDSWSFTAGGTVWLSTTAGALTTTQPATTGDKIQAIGKALTATQLLLRPSQDYGTAP